MNADVLALLEARFPIPAMDYYRRIALWDAWWRGHDRTFHEFTENPVAGHSVRRQLDRMNMAKKVAEDWAALLLNDRTSVDVADPAGAAFVSRVFAETDFLRQANRLVERAFAVGTGAAILRLTGKADADGRLIASPDKMPGISFEFLDARHIVPLSVENGEITEAAFVSEAIRRGEEVVYLEIHTRAADGYVIRNEFYRFREGRIRREKNPAGCPGEIRTGSPRPLFSILTPNIVSSAEGACGLGMSVYADALDCLKGVDLAFNNFCRDIKLGGKKVFLNQTLVSRDEWGNILTPDDVAQQLFVTVGDADIAEHPMIAEHNPELRSSENAEAVQCQPNYLSFRCGLGAHHYTFADTEARARLTATQYMGERQDMRQNMAKHQKNVERFLRGAVRALLWCAARVIGLPVDEACDIRIRFDDAYFTDTESQRERDLRELAAGVLTAEEYRRKWIGGTGEIGGIAEAVVTGDAAETGEKGGGGDA